MSKIYSSNVLLPPTASADSAGDFVGDCHFIDVTVDAFEELSQSLKQGVEAREPKKKGFSPIRLWKAASNPTPSEMIVLRKIYKLWNNCIEAINAQKGKALFASIRDLIQVRDVHPKEFASVVHGMGKTALSRVFNHLMAVGNLFLMFDAAHKSDRDSVSQRITKAVHFFHRGGVPTHDESLERYRKLFV